MVAIEHRDVIAELRWYDFADGEYGDSDHAACLDAYVWFHFSLNLSLSLVSLVLVSLVSLCEVWELLLLDSVPEQTIVCVFFTFVSLFLNFLFANISLLFNFGFILFTNVI